MKYVVILTVFFIVLFSLFSMVNAQSTYTPSRETHCNNGECYTTLYSGVRFAQNSTGDWVNPSEVLYMTRNQDDISFHYNGIKGYYNVTFEAGVIYNSNYYSMSEVKQMKPNIHFSFPSEKRITYHKYAVNITNITENLNPDLIENVTLTYKNHYGFTLEQLKQGNRWFHVKNTMALYFEDLIKLHPLKIIKSEKRLYISNITDNIINGNIYLDPTIMLQNETTENLGDTYANRGNSDSTHGTNAHIIIGSGYPLETYNDMRIYIMFNISSVPNGINILNATLYLTRYSGSSTVYADIHHVIDHLWTSDSTSLSLDETTLTWNNQTCGVNFDNSTYCNLTAEDTEIISANIMYNWTVTNAIKNETGDGDKNVSFVLKNNTESLGTIAFESDFRSKEYITDTTKRPYLNITYTDTVPKWSSNATSIPSNFSTTEKSYFNVTWENSIDTVLFESNYSGSATNYTMTNSYGGDIYNYTISTILSPDDYYWKSYANDTGDDWNTTDKWNFTIETTAPSIPNFELNDTYININGTVLLTVNASQYAIVTATLQTSGGSTNYTLTYQSTGNYTYTFTKTQLGLNPVNSTRVNITNIYTDGSNYTMTKNTSTLYVDYGRSAISSSYSPPEPENLPASTITFTVKYNTTENTYITSNCSVTVKGITHYMTYSGGTHTVAVSTAGWTLHAYSYSISCSNSSYESQSDSGTFTLYGAEESGGGGGEGFTFPRTQEEAQEVFQETIEEIPEKIIEPFKSPIVRIEFAFLGITIVVAGYYQLSYKKKRRSAKRHAY